MQYRCLNIPDIASHVKSVSHLNADGVGFPHGFRLGRFHSTIMARSAGLFQIRSRKAVCFWRGSRQTARFLFRSPMSQRKPFPFPEFESRWQQHWLSSGVFRAPNPGDADFDGAKPKYYVLDMFPYPSGEGLHVGHVEGYTATDILARYKRMQGFNVLHPMGWDAFGLPAEQFAIKTGQHPRVTTERNVGRFREQLKRIVFSYDWSREISTTDPG